jgi:hypothetical protein
MTRERPLQGTVEELFSDGLIRVKIDGGDPFVNADPKGRAIEVGDVVRLAGTADERRVHAVIAVVRRATQP